MSELKMPWGKFKGKKIVELPSKYLYWVAENWENDNIATIADVEWRRREEDNEHYLYE